MRRAALGLFAWLAIAGQVAMAQDKEASPPADEPSPPAEEPAGEPPAAEPPAGGDVKTPVEEVKPGTRNWSDIYVVPRRAVLKRKRLEFMPTYNVTINNPVIRHHGIGGALNIYLSEAFFIGLEGTYYGAELTDRYFLLGVDQRVLPSVNKYVWSALLDFGYVPIHGKFTLFNSTIFHWEVYIAAGIGAIATEVVPRDPANSKFDNINIAFMLPGIGTRMWLNRWFAIDAYIKDYIFPDKLENTSRSPGETSEKAKELGENTLVFNLVFGLGISLFLPPSFEYKTLR